MPKSTSAEKAARASERKRLRNRSIKSASKTYVAKAEGMIQGNELDSAQAVVTEAISVLDKAAKKRVIHPHTASRRKSRLMKKLQKAKAAAKTTATTAEAKTKKKN